MPEEETSHDPVFIFRFNVIFIHAPLQTMVDDDDDNNDFVPQLDNSQISSETIEETFQVLRERILQESTSGSAIFDMLCAVRVPLEIQDPMVHTISACAREAVRQTQMAGRRALEVWVTINVWQYVYEESWISNYSQISEHAMKEGYVLGLPARTAPKSSIEGIADQQCAICLEDLSGGSEAARMPCLHLFHGNCIGKWLERSLFCPLCRFQLPGSR